MFNPVPNMLTWKFMQEVLHSPQQLMGKVFPLCKMGMFSGQNQFQTIVPQVDGIDYDPESDDLRKGTTPFMEYSVKRVGYKKRAHIWSHAIDTVDLHRTIDAYSSMLASLTSASVRRFKDRVIASNCDNSRITLTGGNLGTPTSEAFPAANRYAILDTTNTTTATFQAIDLDTLHNASLYFKNNYSSDSAMGATVNCLASPSQIHNLLNEDKITNQDYNVVRALVRGEINTFYGMDFVHTKAGGTISASDSVYFKAGLRTVKIAATAGYAKLGANVKAEKVLFAIMNRSYEVADVPSFNYAHVWQNPNSAGTWEHTWKQLIAYKRCQNEYSLVAYAKDFSSTGTALRVAPIQDTKLNTNRNANSGAGSWSYSLTAA